MVNQITMHLKRCNPVVCWVKDKKHWKSRTKTSTDDYKQTTILKFNLQAELYQISFKQIIRVQHAAEFK